MSAYRADSDNNNGDALLLITPTGVPNMASLFRPTYTRDGQRFKSRIWWAQFRDHLGRFHRLSMKTPNKAAAQLKLGQLLKEVAAGRDGTTAQAAASRPIAVHVADFDAYLRERCATAAHATMTLVRLRRIVDGCQWRTLADIDGAEVDRLLLTLHTPRRRGGTDRPIAAKTRNDYRESLRSFVRWCLRNGRLGASPIQHWRGESIATDRRHDRRPLSPANLARLLESTAASRRVFRYLDGAERHALYLCAVATGFRANELASLTPESFELDAEPPAVVLAATRAKNRKPTRQPLPADVVPFLRDYLGNKNAKKTLWPGSWKVEGGEMLQADLAEAGLPYVVHGPDGPLYSDFHSLRHTYIAMLDRAGVTIKQAMQLARHSKPELTLRVYGRAQLAELGNAVNGMPLPLSPTAGCA